MPYRGEGVTHHTIAAVIAFSAAHANIAMQPGRGICIWSFLHYDKSTSPARSAGVTRLPWHTPQGETQAHDQMTPSARSFILLLIMLALPLQGVLAAVMPLCSQASHARHTYMAAQPEAGTHQPVPVETCRLHSVQDHEEDGHEISVKDGNAAGNDLPLSCDGIVCHISGNSLPPAASALNFAGGFSYAFLPAVPFSSIIPPQPQRPPLA